MVSVKNLLATAALVSMAQAKTVTVTAKEDNTFDPEDPTASKGDTIEFKFEKGNHSVVGGLYDWPCTPQQLGTSFFSGFIDSDSGDADKVFRIKINDTEPVAFYSSVDKQCSKGMVGVINANKTMSVDKYKKEAAKQSGNVSPGSKSFGGDVEDSDSSSNDDDSNDDSSSDSSKGDSSSSDNSKGDNEDAAGAFGVPLTGLLAAVGVAFFMA